MGGAEHADRGRELVAGAAKAAFGPAAARAIGPTTDGASSAHSRATRGTPTSQTKLGSPSRRISLAGEAPAVAQLFGAGRPGRSVATPASAPEQERRRTVARILLAARRGQRRRAPCHRRGDESGSEPERVRPSRRDEVSSSATMSPARPVSSARA